MINVRKTSVDLMNDLILMKMMNAPQEQINDMIIEIVSRMYRHIDRQSQLQFAISMGYKEIQKNQNKVLTLN